MAEGSAETKCFRWRRRGSSRKRGGRFAEGIGADVNRRANIVFETGIYVFRCYLFFRFNMSIFGGCDWEVEARQAETGGHQATQAEGGLHRDRQVLNLVGEQIVFTIFD